MGQSVEGILRSYSNGSALLNKMAAIPIYEKTTCLMIPDCDSEGQIFLSTPHTHDRFIFLHTFLF